jgi:hypothetical protein
MARKKKEDKELAAKAEELAAKELAEKAEKEAEEKRLEEEGLNHFFKGGAKPSDLVQQKKKKNPKDRDVVEFEAKFDVLCAAAVLSKVAAATKKALQGQYVVKTVFTHFKDEMEHTRRQASTFDAVSVTGKTAAQWQYAKKGFGFSADTADILASFGIPFETRQKQIEGWMLNPEIEKNPDLIVKMGKALRKAAETDIPELLAIEEPFIPQEGKKTFTFNDLTIQGIIEKVKDPLIQSALLKEIAGIKLAHASIDGQEVTKNSPPNSNILKKAFEILTQNADLDQILSEIVIEGDGEE